MAEQRRPLWVRGEGLRVWDESGRRYLDAISGSFCVQLGYDRPDLVRAMTEAAERLPYARPSRSESAESLAYARALIEAAGPPYTRAYLTSSGSEAVDLALKAAYRCQRAAGHPAPERIAHLAGHFHGATLGALGVSGYRARRAPYGRWLGEARGGPAAYCRRCFAALAYPSCAIACAEGAAPPEFAALILETIPAAGLGAPIPPPGYLARVRALCDASGALWIADEVLTGFGRTGDLFAWRRLAGRPEDRGAAPDLVVFGKGAGAGFAPLAGVLATERVARWLDSGDADGPFAHRQTYGGNPVACAVGRRVLDVLERERIGARVLGREGALERAMRSLESHPLVHDVRGLGFLWGVELAADRATGEPFPRAHRVAERLEAECLARGLLVYAAAGCADGDRGDFVLIAPALTAGARDFTQIAARLRGALDALAAPGTAPTAPTSPPPPG